MLTETEVRSRYEVKLEKYNKLLNIEARTMKRMVRRAYLPAINSYAAEVAGHINAIRSACAGADTDQQEELLRRLLLGIKEIDTQLRALGKLHHETLEIESEQEKANTYAHEVIPVMDRLRAASTGSKSSSIATTGPFPRTTTSCSTCKRNASSARLCRGRLHVRLFCQQCQILLLQSERK